MVGRGIKLNLGGNESDLFDQFFLAVEMNDYELAAGCLRHRPVSKWSAEDSVFNPDARCFQDVGSLTLSVFDISAMTYNEYCELDPEIAWALLRSGSLAKLAHNGLSFEENYRDEFLKLMRIQCEYLPDVMVGF